MKPLSIIKVGGAVVEDDRALEAFLGRFAAMQGARILVHGGGRSATALADRLGLPTSMVAGRRVTDAATLDLVTMTYAGRVNKRIVSALQCRGVDALGLSGADARCVCSSRRPPVPVGDRTVDYGLVGDVREVRVPFFDRLLSDGFIPVLSPLSWCPEDGLLNTNADTMASALAVALAESWDVTLSFCFEQPGVLSDPADPASVIPRLDAAAYAALKASGAVSGGMIPKLDNAFAALAGGVRAVRICSAEQPLGGTLIHGETA